MRELSLGEVLSVGGGCDDACFALSQLKAAFELARVAAATGDMDVIAQGNAAAVRHFAAQHDNAAMKRNAAQAQATAMQRLAARLENMHLNN